MYFSFTKHDFSKFQSRREESTEIKHFLHDQFAGQQID